MYVSYLEKYLENYQIVCIEILNRMKSLTFALETQAGLNICYSIWSGTIFVRTFMVPKGRIQLTLLGRNFALTMINHCIDRYTHLCFQRLNCSLSSALTYDQIPAKLMIFP